MARPPSRSALRRDSRHAGLLLPLFSIRSGSDWGIGELPDAGPLCAWLADAGFDRLMLLPLGTMTGGTSSPYAAASAMAIDPIYIAVDRLEDFVQAGGTRTLSAEAIAHLMAARSADSVDYARVRAAKAEALERAFDRFLGDEWERQTLRAATLAGFLSRERGWLDDYALFQALRDRCGGRSWYDWDEPLRSRHPAALDEARRRLARDVLRQQYWQWIAHTQWAGARQVARGYGVAMFGDLPFVVSGDSVEVWSRQDEFLLDVSVGVPPDAFSDTGQDWGLPMYRWDVIAAGGYQAFHARVRRMAALFDGVRVDHLVGLYRTYGRPPRGQPFFFPADAAAQQQQGEEVLRVFLDSGLSVIAEDLGTVPDFVRASMTRLGVPGCKVLRWERHWHAPGQPFIDPAAYPQVSAAMTGTHDTESMAEWWERAPLEEREALLELQVLRAHGLADPSQPWSDALRDALLEQIYRSRSDELFLPLQDLFGWRDRINTPGTIGDHNWTWRMPWRIEDLEHISGAVERARFGRRTAVATSRGTP
jgi:4-alpha-glucanotransferase